MQATSMTARNPNHQVTRELRVTLLSFFVELVLCGRHCAGSRAMFFSFVLTFILVCLFVFFFLHTAYGILIPQQGVEPGPLAAKARIPNPWTTRESPCSPHL